MEKLARKIFQPNVLTNALLEYACGKNKVNLSDFINSAIMEYLKPINPILRKETEFIFTRISNQEKIEPEELQAALARCVEMLKDYPISSAEPLEQIFIHFTTTRGHSLRYDYIQIVNDLQDYRLHRLNEIIKTVDRDFPLGTREFGERGRYVFAHWDELCEYSEVYLALSTIIECENIYYPLNEFRTIDLIKWLDLCIQESKLKPIKTPFETSISLEEKYGGISYEASTYQTDKGYCELSGDISFQHMSPEIIAYYEHYTNHHTPSTEITEDDIEKIMALEQEGRMLFKRLRKE